MREFVERTSWLMHWKKIPELVLLLKHKKEKTYNNNDDDNNNTTWTRATIIGSLHK